MTDQTRQRLERASLKAGIAVAVSTAVIRLIQADYSEAAWVACCAMLGWRLLNVKGGFGGKL